VLNRDDLKQWRCR